MLAKGKRNSRLPSGWSKLSQVNDRRAQIRAAGRRPVCRGDRCGISQPHLSRPGFFSPSSIVVSIHSAIFTFANPESEAFGSSAGLASIEPNRFGERFGDFGAVTRNDDGRCVHANCGPPVSSRSIPRGCRGTPPNCRCNSSPMRILLRPRAVKLNRRIVRPSARCVLSSPKRHARPAAVENDGPAPSVIGRIKSRTLLFGIPPRPMKA